MDYRLKRQVIAITVFLLLGVVVIVFLANWKTISRKLGYTKPATTVSASVEPEAALEPQSNVNQIGDNLYGWMTAAGFFDGEKNVTLAEKVSTEMNSLNISVNSIERDIRISIYGYGDVLKTGEKFEIKVESTSDIKNSEVYKDANKDGIVYVSDLEPGEYRVSLVPYEGYKVPENSTKIRVKDKADCVKISDITLIMKEDTNVVKRVEDTMEHSASFDKGPGMHTGLDAREFGVYGAELSSADKDVDFAALYEEGIRFVMLRAGYRSSKNGDIIVDSSFADYAAAAHRAGLDVGAYWFSQAVTEVEAIEEASALLELAAQYAGDYPLMLMLDSAGGKGRADSLTMEKRTANALAFLKTVKSTGLPTAVYASADWLGVHIDTDKIENYGIWLGDYEEIPSYEGIYDFWQYTDEGELDELDGMYKLSVDLRK